MPRPPPTEGRPNRTRENLLPKIASAREGSLQDLEDIVHYLDEDLGDFVKGVRDEEKGITREIKPQNFPFHSVGIEIIELFASYTDGLRIPSGEPTDVVERRNELAYTSMCGIRRIMARKDFWEDRRHASKLYFTFFTDFAYMHLLIAMVRDSGNDERWQSFQTTWARCLSCFLSMMRTGETESCPMVWYLGS